MEYDICMDWKGYRKIHPYISRCYVRCNIQQLCFYVSKQKSMCSDVSLPPVSAVKVIESVLSVCVCMGLWDIHCHSAPFQWYRTMLCTTDLHCTPRCTRGPMSLRRIVKWAVYCPSVNIRQMTVMYSGIIILTKRLQLPTGNEFDAPSHIIMIQYNSFKSRKIYLT